MKIISRFYIYKFLFLFFIVIVLFTGCSKEDYTNEKTDRTILVYMAANNTLDSYVSDNLAAMLKGSENGKLHSGNLLIFLKQKGKLPQLLQIKNDSQGKASLQVIKTYDNLANVLSSETMKMVIEEVREQFPAAEYGLVLWSHGMGWLPTNVGSSINYSSERISLSAQKLLRRQNNLPTKYFGEDGTSKMELKELASALPDQGFRFILFDACYMSGIEVAYELRHKTDYLIAAPSEILATGFPYQTVIPDIFSPQFHPESICFHYFSSYYIQKGAYQSATIGLIKTSELELLADLTRDIISQNFAKIKQVDTRKLQSFDRFTVPLLFDFEEYMEQIATPEQYVLFRKQLKQAVPFAAATRQFISFEINRHCGLSSYVPTEQLTAINQFYTTLSWYSRVYPVNLQNKLF